MPDGDYREGRADSKGQGEPQTGLVEQYTHYAESATEVSKRRLRANQFYISVLSTLFVVVTFLAQAKPTVTRLVGLSAIGLLGVLLCGLWYQTVDSHRRLNEAKYEVINHMEDDLPRSPYSDEWELIGPERDEQNRPDSRVKLLFRVVLDILRNRDDVQYYEQTTVEKAVAGAMAVPYLGVIIYSLLSLAEPYLI